jgi:hypothetical protein
VEEHQQLQQACESSGCRNLSDFVRLELLSRVQSRMVARINMAALAKRLSDLEDTYSRAMAGMQTKTEQGDSNEGNRS